MCGYGGPLGCLCGICGDVDELIVMVCVEHGKWGLGRCVCVCVCVFEVLVVEWMDH